MNGLYWNITNPGVYMITATNANYNIFYMSQGSSCNIKMYLNVMRVLNVSSTTNIYFIAYSLLSSPVFYMSSDGSSSITYTRIA